MLGGNPLKDFHPFQGGCRNTPSHWVKLKRTLLKWDNTIWETNVVNRTKTLSKIPSGGWLTSWLFTKYGGVDLGPPNTNPFGCREEDLNLEPPDYWQFSAVTTWPCCLQIKQATAVLSTWPYADLTNVTFFNFKNYLKNQVKTSLKFFCSVFFLFCSLGVWKVEIWQGVRRKMICQSPKP